MTQQSVNEILVFMIKGFHLIHVHLEGDVTGKVILTWKVRTSDYCRDRSNGASPIHTEFAELPPHFNHIPNLQSPAFHAHGEVVTVWGESQG